MRGLLRFESLRLVRDVGFVIVLAVLVSGGLVQAALDPATLPFSVWFLPLVGVWVGAFDLAGELRAGRFDAVVSRGSTLPDLLWCRFILALLVSVGSAALVMAPAFVTGHGRWSEATTLLGVLVYWAAVGAALGFVVSGAGAVLLALGLSMSVTWWVMAGCALLTGSMPTAVGWSVVSCVAQAVGNVVPAGQLRLFHSLAVVAEALRWPVAGMVLFAGHRWADRRNLQVREEG